MEDLTVAIPIVRESIAAILRLRLIKPEKIGEGKTLPPQFNCSWGSAFCVVSNRYLLTAFHVLNGGEARNVTDKFYALVVPGNGSPFFFFPLVAFPLERPDLDIAVIEIGACSNPSVHLPALPVTFAPQSDGMRVITVGFPAPIVVGLNVDAQSNFLGGQFFLKSHANEGIVSAQYIHGSVPVYELNIGWHHGESGGPIVALSERPAVFSIMQQYRNIQSPHGVLPGPHRGCSLFAIQGELEGLGVKGI
ncbi:MAG: serine protease [Candidatus Omnitrophica bacterium]|nr:serine protease [Candidatus Omnitrophota bacterium]MDD5353440.1 serine protease [Candidatus Omnitrophota bacterium]MDD5551445.1 serine protease [Candidatus Omnitrophota bacterium]